MRRGFTVTELVVVVGIIAVIAVAAAPVLRRAYVRQQVKVSASQVQSLVQRARMSAVKEKVSYRLVVHDEDAAVPNRLELQRKQGASFATLHTYTLPAAVRLLGSSLSSMTVSSLGTCSSGNVYVQAADYAYEAVSIKPTCLTENP